MTDMHREASTHQICSAYVASSHSCANGFPVLTGICYGCEGSTPLCMRDDYPSHLMQDDGKPMNYPAAIRHLTEQNEQRDSHE